MNQLNYMNLSSVFTIFKILIIINKYYKFRSFFIRSAIVLLMGAMKNSFLCLVSLIFVWRIDGLQKKYSNLFVKLMCPIKLNLKWN